mgnify:CR=1 FL=1
MKAIEKIIAITSPTDVVNDGNTLIIDTINKKLIFDNMNINLSSIENNESSITSIESSITSIKSDITDIESDITDITTRVTALETPTNP